MKMKTHKKINQKKKEMDGDNKATKHHGMKMKTHKKINQKKKEMDGDNKATKHHGMMDIEDVNDIEFCDKGRISKDSLKSKGTWTWSRHLHSKHTYSRFNRSFGWMQRGNNELMV
eukprot:576451_1